MSGQADVVRLVEILANVAGPDRTPEHVSAETPLSEGGFWLDSADLLEVMLACEGVFSVTLDPTTILPQGSDLTVARLMRAIESVRRP